MKNDKSIVHWKLKWHFFFFVIVSMLTSSVFAQSQKRLTLDNVLEIAKTQSPQSILAKHRFLGNYWEYRTFKAKYRPALMLSGVMPAYNRSFEKRYNSSTGEDEYVEINQNNVQLGLDLTQNIGLTGASVFARSEIQRLDNFGDTENSQYITTPVSAGFHQPLFAYNPLKWEKKIEPIKYEEAKKSYIDNMEQVYSRAVTLFFNLALAEQNMRIAIFNYSNSDTLYLIAQGRYNIGTIAEDELLQMQLRFLNAGADLNQRQIDLQIQEFRLRSFLGYNDNVSIELIIPSEIPDLTVDVSQALSLAYENNPEILGLERQLIEAERDVAIAKGEKGLNANLTARFGYSGSGTTAPDAYTNFDNTQMVNLQFSVPIMDWGLGRGKYKMAQSNQEVVRTNVMQDRIDFDQSVFLAISQFNFQDDQLSIAAKSDTIASRRYEVTKQRFLIGKIDVLELNVADSEKDVAKRNFITALRNYWTDFYNVRRLTLYDFIKNEGLTADFDSLVD